MTLTMFPPGIRPVKFSASPPAATIHYLAPDHVRVRRAGCPRNSGSGCGRGNSTTAAGAGAAGYANMGHREVAILPFRPR